MARTNTFGRPHDELPREQRRQLTSSLLDRAGRATGPEREELLEQVILLNMCVARSIASRYVSRGIARDDLEQVANASLVRTVQQFDAGRDCDFLSYAVPSIRGELRRYFRDQGWMVRPPRRVQELQSKVVEERSKLQGHEQGEPCHAEIAAHLGVTETEVVEALQAEGCFTPRSLDVRLGEAGSSSLGDLLEDPGGDQGQDAAEARVMLRPVVRQLRPRDRKLLRMRFFEERTQQEIADELGVTQTQVSRLLSRLLTELRRQLTH